MVSLWKRQRKYTEIVITLSKRIGFLGGLAVKNLPANVEDASSILGQEDSLEKEMVTHSSNFAWEIPWTEEPRRLQSLGSVCGQRVGHNLVIKQQQEKAEDYSILSNFVCLIYFRI